MKKASNDKQTLIFASYRLVNLVFAGIIVLILLYSLVFEENRNPYPLHSGTLLFTSESTISTGLSRSFTAIMHGKIKQAYAHNVHGPQLFLFFVTQLFFRLIALWISYKVTTSSLRKLIHADIMVSVILFVVLFMPFITAMVKQLAVIGLFQGSLITFNNF